MTRVLSRDKARHPNAAMCLNFLQEGWLQYFGRPRVLRLDPAGPFRSHCVEGFCDRHGIFLDIIPGEAHWKLGACEQAVQGLKSTMTKMCETESDLDPAEAPATATMVFNHREIIRVCPDETGKAMDAMVQAPVESLAEDPQGEFERAARRRAEAEKAHAEWKPSGCRGLRTPARSPAWTSNQVNWCSFGGCRRDPRAIDRGQAWAVHGSG